MNESIHALFQPRTIAVIGASRKENSVGRGIMKNLLMGNYQGLLFPVNPKAESVLSIKCHDSLMDIEEPVDLAVIAIPRDAVTKAMQQCAKKGVKAVVVLSAGFKETDEKGEDLEKEIAAIARENKMALVGPNCLGVINTHPEHRMNATFANNQPSEGNISFISQSGAVGVYALEYARQHHISFSRFASLGNKALTDESDILESMLKDEQTHVVLSYLEDFEEPKRFFELAAKNSCSENPKPLAVIKAGSSSSGKRAAASHTGALTESGAFLDDLFSQFGILRMNSLEALFQSSLALAHPNKPNGKKLCILTNAGGPGIISADAAERAGLEIPELSEDLQEALKEKLPATASFGNPIDLVGDADAGRYEQALEILTKSDEVDMILLICTPQLMTDMENIAESLGMFSQKNSNQLLVAAFADFRPSSTVFQKLGQHQVPAYRFTVNAIEACRHVAGFRELSARPQEDLRYYKVNRDKAKSILEKAKPRDNHFLTEVESYGVFEAYGFKVAAYRLLGADDDPEKTAADLSFPLVAKAMSAAIVHKSDEGAVVTGIQNMEELKEKVEELKARVSQKHRQDQLQGILLQQMQQKGTEIILGARYEEGYGHLLMCGIGGIFVEILKDVSYRLAPIKPHDAKAMLQGIKHSKMLEGARGKEPVNREALEDYLLRLSQLVSDFPQIREIDLNPVFAFKDKAVLADARIITR